MTSIGIGNDAPADTHSTTTPAPIRAHSRSEIGRRILNVLISAVALVLAAPVMLLVAVLIRLTSRGPIITTQTCVGINRRSRNLGIVDHRRSANMGGRPITIYKFRTTAVGPYARAPQTTRVGRMLRSLRLDELPQLFNVLRGDMNLVGPRPHQPAIFALLRTQLERYAERQRVLPGITGWAQVQRHYYAAVEDVATTLRFDLEYVAHRSTLQDCRILLQTVPRVLLLEVGER